MTQIELQTLTLACTFFKQATKTLAHLDQTLTTLDQTITTLDQTLPSPPSPTPAL